MPAHQLKARVDRRVDDDAARVRLVGIAEYFPVLAEVAGDRRVIGLRRDDLDDTIAARDRRRSAFEPGACHHGGDEPRLCRERRHIGAGHAGMCAARAAGLRCRKAECAHHCGAVEPKHASDCGRRTDAARNAGDVPAAARSSAGRRDGCAQPALDLHADHQRGEKVLAAKGLRLRKGEQRRDHRSRWMRDGREVGIVVRMRCRSEAVDHSGARRIETLAPSDDAACSR